MPEPTMMTDHCTALTRQAEGVLATDGHQAYVQFLIDHFADFQNAANGVTGTESQERPAHGPGNKHHSYLPWCAECGSEDVIDDREQCDYVCRQCGLATQYMCSDERTHTFEETQRLVSAKFWMGGSRGYKRMSHFNDVLSQLMGRQRTDTAPGVESAVRESIKKHEADTTVVTGALVRRHMKVLKLGHHYEDAFMVANAITRNAAVIRVDHRLEEDLRHFFRRIQRAFDDVKVDSKRKSFLNYSYVLYQFLRMLGRLDIAAHLHMLKARSRLVAHDVIFGKICDRLGWVFVPLAPVKLRPIRIQQQPRLSRGKATKGKIIPALITTPPDTLRTIRPSDGQALFTASAPSHQVPSTPPWHPRSTSSTA